MWEEYNYGVCSPQETANQRKERRIWELNRERRQITERLLAIETELSELD